MFGWGGDVKNGEVAGRDGLRLALLPIEFDSTTNGVSCCASRPTDPLSDDDEREQRHAFRLLEPA